MTPCGLVDKYQHPEEPAAYTFSHVLPSVLQRFLKQLVSEARNKTDVTVTVTALLLFCDATEHSGLTVGRQPVQLSGSDQRSMFCTMKHNGDHGMVSPLFYDVTPRHRVNGVQRFGTTTATKHRAQFTQ